MLKYFFLLFATIAASSCSEEHELWPYNGAKIEAIFYQLSISDSSKILTPKGSDYEFIDLEGLKKTNLDTIKYTKPRKEITKYFNNIKIKTTKSYNSKPNVYEYYAFVNGALKLAGFSTSDSLISLSTFDNPLIILPAYGVKSDSTSAIKQNWSTEKNQFIQETKTRTKVKLVKTGTIIYKKHKEEFMLYELTLSGDAKVSYGEKELIVPDAIYLKSLLLVSKTKGLLYEWSIKGQQSQTEPNNPEMLLSNNFYIELIKYNVIN